MEEEHRIIIVAFSYVALPDGRLRVFPPMRRALTAELETIAPLHNAHNDWLDEHALPRSSLNETDKALIHKVVEGVENDEDPGG